MQHESSKFVFKSQKDADEHAEYMKNRIDRGIKQYRLTYIKNGKTLTHEFSAHWRKCMFIMQSFMWDQGFEFIADPNDVPGFKIECIAA